MQNQSAQPYSQSTIPQGQNHGFYPQSNASNYLSGQYMNSQASLQGQYGNMPSQGSFSAQYSNLPPGQAMNPNNQLAGSYANNRPQYNNQQIPPGTFQNAASGPPNFMPPYNPGNQGYNR